MKHQILPIGVLTALAIYAILVHATELRRKSHVCHVHKAINPMIHYKVALTDKSLETVITT